MRNGLEVLLLPFVEFFFLPLFCFFDLAFYCRFCFFLFGFFIALWFTLIFRSCFVPVFFGSLSHSVLRSKLDAIRMYAQDQVVIHTARM
jgi:hypothetical protein